MLDFFKSDANGWLAMLNCTSSCRSKKVHDIRCAEILSGSGLNIYIYKRHFFKPFMKYFLSKKNSQYFAP